MTLRQVQIVRLFVLSVAAVAIGGLIAELERQLPATLPDGSLIPEDFETPQTLCDRLEQL